MSSKSLVVYYFVKGNPNETICEKVKQLNMFPSQFSAALSIRNKTWGRLGCASPQVS